MYAHAHDTHVRRCVSRRWRACELALKAACGSIAGLRRPEKEHYCDRIIQLVHCIEVWHFRNIHQVTARPKTSARKTVRRKCKMNNKCSRVQAGAANICMQQEQEHARFQWGEGNKHDGKILNLVCDVVERLVHLHARLQTKPISHTLSGCLPVRDKPKKQLQNRWPADHTRLRKTTLNTCKPAARTEPILMGKM